MILLLLVTAAVFYFAEMYSLKHVFDGVRIRTETDRVLIEPGEAFRWTVTAVNGKRLMIPYLRLRESVPQGLLFAGTNEPVEKREQVGLVSTFYLAGRQEIRFEREVMMTNRGRYFFRGVSAEAGDFLGILSATGSFPELEEIVVKPKAAESPELAELLGGFLGEHAVRRGLMEDPISTVGFREYTGREPFRAISWTQSAKSNRLLVRQYENTVDLACSVLLLISEDWSLGAGGRLEMCLSMVRSVCEELERRRIVYDFRTNGTIAGSVGNWRQIDEGAGPGHLEAVLEALGRMSGTSRETGEAFLARILRTVPQGRSFILMAPTRIPGMDSAAARIERLSGRKTLVLTAAEERNGGI